MHIGISKRADQKGVPASAKDINELFREPFRTPVWHVLLNKTF